MYDKACPCTSINELRKLLFTKKSIPMQNLPPTKASLEQHVRRSVLQGGHYWVFNLASMRFFPSPAGWGWELIEGEWHPYWTDLNTAQESCPELTKCCCRKKMSQLQLHPSRCQMQHALHL